MGEGMLMLKRCKVSECVRGLFFCCIVRPLLAILQRENKTLIGPQVDNGVSITYRLLPQTSI